jgi:release factor glutamine methyltransferase
VQLKDALASAIRKLESDQVPSPRMNAELLLMFTLGVDRAYFYAHPERELTADETQRYDAALAQRSRGVPAQYITGHQEFWGMDFIVTPAVLIPRPETEHVIEKVLELCACDPERSEGPAFSSRRQTTKGQCPITDDQRLRIVDVGTGSGCIAIALAKEFPNSYIHATDISEAALEVARANAARHQLEKRIQFDHTHLLDGVSDNTFDFVVSNPPYVGDSEEDQVQLEVRKFEPRNAVFAGHTGLEVIEKLIPAARRVLKPGGFLVMEISGAIAGGVELLLQDWSMVNIARDLQGIARVASARNT